VSPRIYSAAEARALREAATPGPWAAEEGRSGAVIADIDGLTAQVGSAAGQAARHDLRAEHHVVRNANAALLAAAPDLAASVEHHATRADDAESALAERVAAHERTLSLLREGRRHVVALAAALRTHGSPCCADPCPRLGLWISGTGIVFCDPCYTARVVATGRTAEFHPIAHAAVLRELGALDAPATDTAGVGA